MIINAKNGEFQVLSSMLQNGPAKCVRFLVKPKQIDIRFTSIRRLIYCTAYPELTMTV